VSGQRAGTSGFLGDYSQLEAGGENRARLLYIDGQADFSNYERVVVDPVVVWGDPGDGGSELRELADYFDTALRRQLALEFRVVEDPGPGTLRIRLAITDVEDSRVGIECEILDSAEGTRLVAAVDEREWGAGSGAPSGRAGAEKAFDRWADILRTRLSAFRDYDASQKRYEADP